jgi:hypothetical protein
MFRLSNVLLVLLCYHILSLNAQAIDNLIINESNGCYQPGYKVLPKEQLMDCYAAMDLIPHTGIMPAPDLMLSSAPRFALELTGRDTYKINGDKIRFPAAFLAGRCIIMIRAENVTSPFPDQPDIALLLHLYFWPRVLEIAEYLISSCLKDMQLWVVYRATLKAKNWSFPFMINISILDKGSRMPQGGLRNLNIYDSTGMINSISWPIAFQRPR